MYNMVMRLNKEKNRKYVSKVTLALKAISKTL